MKKFILIIFLILFGNTSVVAQEATSTNVTALYIATFDRAPDAEGLTYWVNTSDLILEDIAKSFFDQVETQEKYPLGYSNLEFIFAIYANLFQRDPDDLGAVYWETELDDSIIDRSFFILAVVNGAIDDDAKILKNKTEVATRFVESGIDNMEMAKDILSNVTADETTISLAIDTLNIITNSNELGERVISAYISATTINPIDGSEADVLLNAEDSYSIVGDIIEYIWKDKNGNILSNREFIEFKAGGNPSLAGDTILSDCEGYVKLTIIDNLGYSDKKDTLLNPFSGQCP